MARTFIARTFCARKNRLGGFMKCFFLFSLLFVIPLYAFSPNNQIGEADFGIVSHRQTIRKALPLVNTHTESLEVSLIEVLGKGYSLYSQNNMQIPPQASSTVHVDFTAERDFKPGVYRGKCVFHVTNPNGQETVYEYVLKATVLKN
jgi:hypothetical protein